MKQMLLLSLSTHMIPTLSLIWQLGYFCFGCCGSCNQRGASRISNFNRVHKPQKLHARFYVDKNIFPRRSSRTTARFSKPSLTVKGERLRIRREEFLRIRAVKNCKQRLRSGFRIAGLLLTQPTSQHQMVTSCIPQNKPAFSACLLLPLSCFMALPLSIFPP